MSAFMDGLRVVWCAVLISVVICAVLGLAIYLLYGQLGVRRGHFVITVEGRTIEAVKIDNPGIGRIYFTKADGTTGAVGGTFTVEEKPTQPEAIHDK